MYHQAGEMHLLFCLVSSGEKAGAITEQAISGGVGVPFLTQNLDGCHRNITFALQRKARIQKQTDRILISTFLTAIEYGFVSS